MDWVRIDRARRVARTEIVLAVAWLMLDAFIWFATPGFMGPMFGPETNWWYRPATVGAWLMPVIGLAWMVRIYRSRPEDGERTWRYRDF